MNSTEISNSQDVIDSRDIIARIKELESDLESAYDEATEAYQDGAKLTFDDWLDHEITEECADDAKEYQNLKALQEEAAGYSEDWKDGSTLIRDSYFEDYAREMAEDIGAIGKDLQWPLMHIDWEAAADALKQDYTSVDFDGVEYWVR
jgi:hypothetical protein